MVSARPPLRLLFALALGAAAAGVAAPKPAVAAANLPVWPAAPDEPRIAFVGEVRGPQDIGVKPSAWRTLARWLTGDQGENLNLRKPFAVALDEGGRLCIADTETGVVSCLDLSRRTWRRFAGVGSTRFVSPVAVARWHGTMYVADSTLGKVFAFNDRGEPVAEIGSPLQRPVGLAIAGDRLCVADAQVHAILVFGLDGRFLSQIGRRGTGPGEFNFPTGVITDHRGRLLVSDTMNCRVQIFDASGAFVAQFGSNGDTSGHFARPKGVAVDAADDIYVVDALFDNFQIFDPAGRLLLNVGQGGGGPGEFGLPAGIAIGADNRIYVADPFNHRVQIFRYLGQP
ncbi:MAG TPA: 6-bladed beta-propeller [Opitutus sp.]|nr:6-bladed beta-propeller [Opitutus sp.]